MRILCLTSQYPTPYRPHSCAHNRQQIAALSQQAEVEVIAPIAWTQEWSAGRELRRRVMPSDRQVRLDSVRVKHPRFRYLPAMFRRWQGPCYRLSVRRVFAEALETFQPDVIYAPWAYPDGWTAVKLGHAANLPVVVKVMGSDVHTLSQYPGRRLGTLETLHEADRIVAVSRQLAEEVVELGTDPDRVQVVYNGVDPELFHPGSRLESCQKLGLDPDLRRVLFVGNLVPVKQVEVLLDACAILRDRAVDFHCHLIGEGPLRAALAAHVERSGLGKRVTLEGQRPHAELADWFRAADVVALPSRSEGVPNVLLEAKACGVPIVASRVGGIPEIISGKPHRLVRSGDSAVFAEAIAEVLATTPSNRFPTRCPADWEASAAALKAVFAEVLNAQRTTADPLPSTEVAAADSPLSVPQLEADGL